MKGSKLMNSQWKYTFEKNKQSIYTGVALVGVLAVTGGVFYAINHQDLSKPEDEVAQIDYNNVRAVNMFTATGNQLDVVQVSTGDIVAGHTFETDVVYYQRAHDLESVYAFDGTRIYEAKYEDGAIQVNTLGEFKLNEKPQQTSLVSFDAAEQITKIEVNEDWIVVATTHGMYTIARADGAIEYLNGQVSDIALNDDEVLYAKGTHLYRQSLVLQTSPITQLQGETIRLKDDWEVLPEAVLNEKIANEYALVERAKEEKRTHQIESVSYYETTAVDFGAPTQALLPHGEQVVVVSEFGEGKGKSALLEVDPNTLLIDGVARHDNKDVHVVGVDSEDAVLAYADATKEAVTTYTHHTIDFETENLERGRVEVAGLAESEAPLTISNTVSTKGYLYTTRAGNLEIFRVAGGVVDMTLPHGYDFFMPISTEAPDGEVE